MKRPHRRNVPSKCEKVAASLAAALRRTKAPSIAARNACGGGTGAAMRCFRFMADDQSSISLSSPGSGSGVPGMRTSRTPAAMSTLSVAATESLTTSGTLDIL